LKTLTAEKRKQLHAPSNRRGKPPRLIFHPDRSEAEWKDLQCALTAEKRKQLHALSNRKGKPPLLTCHPDRSEAEWKDL
jgi:hypothetical protein